MLSSDTYVTYMNKKASVSYFCCIFGKGISFLNANVEVKGNYPLPIAIIKKISYGIHYTIKTFYFL